MTVELIPYNPDHADIWDEFCSGAVNSTILHTRRFLNYHREKFKDLSLLVIDAGKVVGVFPAAQSPSNAAMVVSHPGITYGGIAHQGKLTGNRMITVLEEIATHYALAGYSSLQYKALPFIYASVPAQDDLYALFRLGASRVRCDLSCCIDLAARRPFSDRRRRGLRKALAAVTLSSDPTLLSELFPVISRNLARRYDASPVHSLEELSLLQALFPQQIQIRCALINGIVEAGVIFFNTANVWHAQYIAASEAAYEVSALDAVFNMAIMDALRDGVRFFDFGTSNEDGGTVLNDGLYRFKAEFGGGGVAYEFFELALD